MTYNLLPGKPEYSAITLHLQVMNLVCASVNLFIIFW